MRAVVLSGPGEISIQEVPKPSLQGATDVMLKMQYVGICGSDLHYYKTGRIGDQVIAYPWITGHEGSATVASVGSQVSRVKPGDPVVFDPLIACGSCPQCRMGRRHTCINGRFLGCPGQVQGCMTEYIVLPEACCYTLDKQTDLRSAVLTEPLSIALYAAGMMGNSSSQDIGILGAGPLGLCVLSVLQAAQAGSIFVTEMVDERRETAASRGAGWTGNPDTADIVRDILNIKPEGLDAVFECCGDQEALDQAIALLKPGGMLLIIGIPESDLIFFDISLLRRKEISIHNVRRQNECVDTAIPWILANKDNLSQLITHRFPRDKAADAFALAADYRDGVVKAVIEMAFF